MGYKEIFIRAYPRVLMPSGFFAEARRRSAPRAPPWPARPPGRSAVTRMRAARAGGKHHQAHDRRAADRGAVLLDRDLGLEAAGELDEFRRGARMQAALVDDLEIRGNQRSPLTSVLLICRSAAGWRH